MNDEVDIQIRDLGKQVILFEVTFNEFVIGQILDFVQVFETRAIVQAIKVNYVAVWILHCE